MKTTLDHLPQNKQRELGRIVELLHEEFEDALASGSAEFKKKGRILKIILFGSYARGDWVDEPYTTKAYRSDYDLLIVVNNRKLTDFAAYWEKAQDRLIRDRGIKTLANFIVHSRRDVNTALRQGQYFFSDIRNQGIVLYELDAEPLAQPRLLTSLDALRAAREHFETRFAGAHNFLQLSAAAAGQQMWKEAAFLLHQSVEQSYATILLVLTNYSPASHNLTFLRSLAEDKDKRLAAAWPRDQQRHTAWFNRLNEAYVKARYSKHYEISQEALSWLSQCSAHLLELVDRLSRERLGQLQQEADRQER